MGRSHGFVPGIVHSQYRDAPTTASRTQASAPGLGGRFAGKMPAVPEIPNQAEAHPLRSTGE